MEHYAEKLHVLYMFMLNGIVISVHSFELATWRNPTGNCLDRKTTFYMESAWFHSVALGLFKVCILWESELWNQRTQGSNMGQIPPASPWIMVYLKFWSKHCSFPSSVFVNLDYVLESQGEL